MGIQALWVLALVLLWASPGLAEELTAPIANGGKAVGALDGEVGKGGGLLIFEAEWCSACHQLAYECGKDPQWQALTKGLTVEVVDFDAEESAKLVSKHGVVQLPTLVLVDKGGDEVGRIEGYPGLSETTLSLEALIEGTGGTLLALEAAYSAAKGDKALQYALGRRYLLKGDPKAKALLDGLEGDPVYGLKVVDLYARWYLRAKKDYAKAIDYLEARLEPSACKEESGILYLWLLQSYWAAGKDEQALGLAKTMAATAKDQGLCLYACVTFLLDEGVGSDETKIGLIDTLGTIWKKDATVSYLYSRYYQAVGAMAEAKEHLQAAIALEPDTQLYKDTLHKLSGSLP